MIMGMEIKVEHLQKCQNIMSPVPFDIHREDDWSIMINRHLGKMSKGSEVKR